MPIALYAKDMRHAADDMLLLLLYRCFAAAYYALLLRFLRLLRYC